MTYKDFDLLVEGVVGAFRARVLASPAGQASVDFAFPFSDEKLENYLLRLGRPKVLSRRVESSEMQAAKTFGAALFDAVFSGDVRSCFEKSVEEAKRQNVGLRLRLRLSAAVADLPWEYLYTPAVNRFLALSVQTPLVRYLELPGSVKPFPVSPPLRALVMISSPLDHPQLDVESEWTKLTTSLGDLVERGLVAIDRLDDASLPVLQRQLRKSQYHIFHFIGHGEFDEEAQEGVLILEDDERLGHRISSQHLGMLLHDHASLRLAILNACDGARTSRHDPFAGSAQTLVQQGIPAVIAMQFEIADTVAGTFAHEFYGAVADGYPIDAAVTEARKAIFAAGHDVAWATPVLYLRAPDGRIFDVDRTVPPDQVAKDPSEQAIELVRQAGVALANGKYLDALQYLEQAGTLDPDVPNLSDLMDTAAQQRAVAETRAQRRRAFVEHIAAAGELLNRSNVAEALRHVREALALKPADPDALALQSRIRAAQAHRSPEGVAAGSSENGAQPGPAGKSGDAAVSLGERRKPVDGEHDLMD